MATGGSVEGIQLDGRLYPVPADQDVVIKPGGKENELQMNGDGTGRIIQMRVGGGISGLAVECDSDRGDLADLQEKADRGTLFPFAVTLTDGTVFQGNGQITGAIEYSTQKAIATFALSCAGGMTQQ